MARRMTALWVWAGLAGLCHPAADGFSDPYDHLPASITLNGVCRDFKGYDQNGGHPDFERVPSGGYAHYVGQVKDTLDPDGKPVFNGTGNKVTSQFRNAAGKNIMRPKPYIAGRPGDVAGSISSSSGGSTTSSGNFFKWFRDTPSVNMSIGVPITLVRQTGTDRYVFDDTQDPQFQSLGGFFPINGALYGNYRNTGKNFHFTYELETTFKYVKNAGQVFTFIGDDDVFVFIDGKLVIDIGGVHSKVQQTIELDRLAWLQDGQTYDLKFFFAERHTTLSNFRIETNLELRSVQPPPTTALAD